MRRQSLLLPYADSSCQRLAGTSALARLRLPACPPLARQPHLLYFDDVLLLEARGLLHGARHRVQQAAQHRERAVQPHLLRRVRLALRAPALLSSRSGPARRVRLARAGRADARLCVRVRVLLQAARES